MVLGLSVWHLIQVAAIALVGGVVVGAVVRIAVHGLKPTSRLGRIALIAGVCSGLAIFATVFAWVSGFQ